MKENDINNGIGINNVNTNSSNEVNKEECNHELNGNMTTLVRLPARLMVVPEKIYCQCKNCKKIFTFFK